MQVQDQLVEILWILVRIERKVDQIMTEQTQLDATAQQIETDVTAENAAITAVQQEIATLEQQAAAGAPLDFTNPNKAVGDLGTAPASTPAATPAG